MKQILWDINEMSDSTEVYEARPNPLLIGVIYLVFAIIIASLLWMHIATIDIVVKGSGLIKGEENGTNISCGISGKVKSCEVMDGQYVEEGQTLFTLEVDSLDDSIEGGKEELEALKQRIEILIAYQESLDGNSVTLESLCDNPYYSEFQNRRALLEANIELNDENTNAQRAQYQNNIDNTNKSIDEYEKKIIKLEKAIKGIKERKNPFKKKESYYHSIVSSYIANYKSLSIQYDNQIAVYQSEIDVANKEKQNISQDDKSTIETIDSKIQESQQNIDRLNAEKKAAMQSLELEQLAGLEQEITATKSTIKSLKSNLSSVEAQMDSLNNKSEVNSADLSIMTEKSNIAAELLSYENKRKECENNLDNLIVQDGNCRMLAITSGYVMMRTEIKRGMYLSQGTEICQILPERNGGYYVEVYIKNQDVAKLVEGQEVKLEIGAYPSREYGYFMGELESISKDVKVDPVSGDSYYLGKVQCTKTTVTNKKGETGMIQNGMACQATIIVDEQRVLDYVIEKIKLTD